MALSLYVHRESVDRITFSLASMTLTPLDEMLPDRKMLPVSPQWSYDRVTSWIFWYPCCGIYSVSLSPGFVSFEFRQLPLLLLNLLLQRQLPFD
jgi:hypothetical protein